MVSFKEESSIVNSRNPMFALSRIWEQTLFSWTCTAEMHTSRNLVKCGGSTNIDGTVATEFKVPGPKRYDVFVVVEAFL